jgi:thiamine pyrophosphate-dependent acetolactate synthase large subunit-like protein
MQSKKMRTERRASDLFVECLEAEGVRYVFGIPGEETLDFNESLSPRSRTAGGAHALSRWIRERG